MKHSKVKNSFIRLAVFVTVASALVAAPAQATSASSMPVFSPISHALSNVPAATKLNAADCVTTSWCVAVGRGGNGARMIVGNPAKWSAAQAKEFFAADSGQGKFPIFGQDLTGIDCVSTKWCMAIGGRAYSPGPQAAAAKAVWAIGDPATWTEASFISPLDYNEPLSSVSCVSATYCVGTTSLSQDGSERSGAVFVGDPTTWTLDSAHIVPGFSDVNQVKCVAVAQCTAIGNGGQATITGDPLEWNSDNALSLVSDDIPGFFASGISCPTVNFCTLIGNSELGGIAVSGNPATWSMSANSKALGDNYLMALSCTDATHCLAVGVDNTLLLQSGNPLKWKASTARKVSGPNVTAGSIPAVTCITSSVCLAPFNNLAWNDFSYFFGDPAGFKSNNLKKIILRGAAMGAAMRPSFDSPRMFSCVSETSCTQLGFDDFGNLVVLQGDPQRWQSAKQNIISYATNPVGALQPPIALQCFSAQSCVVVSNWSDSIMVATGDPMKWTTRSFKAFNIVIKNGGVGRFNSLSCTSATWCAAVGTVFANNGTMEPLVIAGNPTTWTNSSAKMISLGKSLNGGEGQFFSISCFKTSSCVVDGTDGGRESTVRHPIFASGDPSSWTSAKIKEIQMPGDLDNSSGRMSQSISCTSATFCLDTAMTQSAQITGGLFISGNPSTWQSSDFKVMGSRGGPEESYVDFASSMCVTSTKCVAFTGVSADGRGILIGDPAKWRNSQKISLTPYQTINAGLPSSASCGGTKCWVAGMDNLGRSFVSQLPSAVPDGYALIKGNLVGPGSDLSNVDLSGGNLSGIDLTGTKLNGANLSNVSSGEITGIPVSLPQGWKLINGYLLGPSANLSNANLHGMNLNGVDLTNAKLRNVSSGSITGTPTNLPDGWKLSNGYLFGPTANISGANLDGIDLSDISLTGVRSAGITGIPVALPEGWKLINGYLVGPGAYLVGANFENCNLSNINLDGADLTNAILTNVSSGGIEGWPALSLNWQVVNGYLVGPGANLAGANITYANLDGVDLTGANLTGLVSGYISGTPLALPTDWQIVNGYLVGPGANLSGSDFGGATIRNVNLSGADLSNASFFGANLEQVNLTGANVQGTDFTSATFSTITSGRITGIPTALPAGWTLTNGSFVQGASPSPSASPTGGTTVNGYLLVPGANLSGANLAKAHLDGLNLSGINFTGANLSLATLTNANLSGANFKSANLAGSNLSNADLTNANFNKTLFAGANINGANLTSAILTGVISKAIKGTPVALPTGWTLVKGVLRPSS